MDMFDDPIDNPYPEFEEEVFEYYFESGLKPEDLRDKEAADKYNAWLEKRK